MKTTTQFIATLLCGAALFAVTAAKAQVTVVATAATTGPTVYPTVDAAFQAINAGTHQGVIGVGIGASTTEAGPCVLNASGAGSASYTSITIAPTVDGVTVSGPTPTGRGLIELNGADNVTVDGDNPNTTGVNRNLTFTNTAANTVTFTSVIRFALSTLITSCDNDIVRNCNLNGCTTGQNVAAVTTEVVSWGIVVANGASTTTTATAPSGLTSALATTGATVTATNLLISNNNIQTASRGIAVNGNAATVAIGLVVSNNIIGNATAGAADQVNGMGISVQGSSNGIVSGNTVRVEGYVQSSSSNRGIDVGTASGTGTFTIERNTIERVYNNDQTSWSAFGINLQGGTNHVVRNNFVGTCKNSQVAGTGAFSTLFGVYGIRIQGGTGHSIDYNTVHFTGVVAGSVSSNLISCLGFTSTTPTGCNVRNNIFSNQLSGGNTAGFNTTLACVYFPTGLTSAFNVNWNNNMYYQGSQPYSVIAQRGTTAGTGNFFAANFNPAVITPATNWRSYTSTLSVAGTNDNASAASSVAPPFISASNLHLNIAAPNIADVDGKAVVIPSITTDFDLAPRDASTPDMGADEVVVASCAGASGGTVTPSTQTLCAGATSIMTSTGATAGTGITYQWMIGTTSGGPYVNVTGGGGATTTSYTTAVLSAGTYYYVLQTTCSNGPVTGLSNELTVTVGAIPTVGVTPTSATYCVGASAVPLTANGASTYAWSPASGLSATTGATVNASPAGGTIYTIVGTSVNGCTATATVSVGVSSAPENVLAVASPAPICIGDTTDLMGSHASLHTLVSQDFTNGLGAWSVVSAPTSPVVSNWSNRTSPFSITGGSIDFTNFTTVNGGNFFMSNSDAGGSGSTTNTQLISPIFSTVGMTSATLSFEHIYQRWASGDVTVAVEISTDGGATYSTLQAYTSDQGTITANAQATATATINLSAYLNQPNLCFRYNYVAVWGYYWLVDAITVSGTSTNTYAWNSIPSGFTSSLQNPADVVPTATTDYVLTVTGPTGCAAMDTVTVMVNPLPVPSISGTAVFCAGDSTTLTSSSASAYQWYMNGVLIPGATNVQYNPTSAGLYNVVVTDVNACSDSVSASTVVSTNALPSVVANVSDTIICTGDAVTFTGSGAVSYTWSGTVTNAVPFTPVMSNTYTVTGTGANGCMNMDSVMVTLNALPTVAASATDSMVCAGDSVTVMGWGATSYAWSGGVMDGVAFSAMSTMTYTVTGTDANGCSDTASIMITANALPNVTLALTQDTACQAAGSIMLMGESPAGGTWSGPGVSGNMFDPMVSGLGMISIDYMYTDTVTGCSSMATDDIWVDLCLGVQSPYAVNGFNVYPNPNNGTFTLQLNTGSAADVMIYDAQSKLVNTYRVQPGVPQQVTVAESGIYLVTVITPEGVRYSQRVVITE